MSEMLKTGHGDSTVSKSKVSRWHKHSREDLNDDETQSIPITKQTEENVAKIREHVQYDRHFVRELCGTTARTFLNYVITGDEVSSLLSRGQRPVHRVEIEDP
jgi:hypothetical protein